MGKPFGRKKGEYRRCMNSTTSPSLVSKVHEFNYVPVPSPFFRPLFSRVCNQCGRCREVCPSGAISEKDGVYKIDPEKCTICQLGVDECPLQALFLHKDLSYPIKCDLCGECAGGCAPEALEGRI